MAHSRGGERTSEQNVYTFYVPGAPTPHSLSLLLSSPASSFLSWALTFSVCWGLWVLLFPPVSTSLASNAFTLQSPPHLCILAFCGRAPLLLLTSAMWSVRAAAAAHPLSACHCEQQSAAI
ncbi:hypothetical protein GQ54DRAFT_295497 [Martensiomyces pterosporus]|nr:hypothetical protein GQ54DRAFT_295497 [Martensiomyces pterosporus]